MFDYETLKLIWWLLVGVLLIGFAVMDGHDMGVGTLLPFVGQGRHRAPGDHQHRRPALGRQPGLVHHRRRRHLRGLAAGLRHGVLRLLLGDARRAVGAVLPPGRFRLPQQDREPDLAQHLGLGTLRRRRRAADDLRRGLWQPAAGRALPFRRKPGLDLHRHVLAAAQSVRPAGGRGQHRDDHVPRRQLPDAPHRGGDLPARAHRRSGVRGAAHRHLRAGRHLGRCRHRRLRGDLRGRPRRGCQSARQDSERRARRLARELLPLPAHRAGADRGLRRSACRSLLRVARLDAHRVRRLLGGDDRRHRHRRPCRCSRS